jgi:ribosomal protein L35
MKTNKSFTKRLRVTKNGKIVARRAGQNHFNAKEAGRGRQARRRPTTILMSNGDRNRFLPNTPRVPRPTKKTA